MMDTGLLSTVLRWLLYTGTVAAAGGLLFAQTFPDVARTIDRGLRRQVFLGCILILVIEPVRLAVFQVQASGGDWGLAFSPDMRGLAFETGFGKALGLRLAGALAILFCWRKSRIAALAAALLMIGSYGLEGHTADEEINPLYSLVLILHVGGGHWWFGALYPLWLLKTDATFDETIFSFGHKAPWVVGGLLIAGGVLAFAIATDVFDFSAGYIQRLGAKLFLVAAVLALAAINKFRLTPRLSKPGSGAREALQTSIKMEVAIGLGILLATAILVGVTP